MALNPGIILAGQSPNIMGSLMAGQQAGQQQNQIQQQNALTDLYRTQGAGIAAGEQGALNALAGVDPMAALGVQDRRLGMDATRLGMDSTRQSMSLQAEAAKRAASEYARSISAEQRAAEAAQLEQGLSGAAFFYSKGDRQGYEAFLQRSGIDPAQFAFDQFPAHAATMGGVLDVLKTFEPEQSPQFRQAGPEEAARYGATGGQFGPDGRFYPINPPSGMSVETGPDGQVRVVQGPGAGAASPKFTEGQSKDNVYATRAEGALATLDPIASELTSATQRAAGMDPTGVIRGAVQSETFQVAQQAGEEFLQAILRKDTGAAITSQEQEMYGKTYLPQPGDGPAVLKTKQEARIRAVEAIKAGMSIEQLAVTDRALVQAAERFGGVSSPQTPPRAEDASLPPGLSADDLKYLGLE